MANIPLCALTDIWNNSGVNYNGINLSITNTASNTGSRMMYIYTSGVDGGSFEITKAGCINKITVGLGAGNVLTNTAIGQYALGSNIVAGNNTAIGQNTLTNNTVGDRNTAVGTCSLANNLSGSYSTSIGNDALLSSYGDQNLAVGYRSGRSITTGNYNVILGSFEADAPYDTQSNNVFIADGAGNLRMYINSSGILTVGAYTTNNGILKTNASGTLSYSTITDDGTTVTANGLLSVSTTKVGIGIAAASAGSILHVNNDSGTATFERLIQGRSSVNNSFGIGVGGDDTYISAASGGAILLATGSDLGVTGTSVPTNVRFTVSASASTLTGNGASTIATSSGNLIFQPVGVSSFGTDAQLNGNSVLWNEAGVRSWTMGTASSTGTLTLQSGDAAGVFRVYTASLYANGVLQVGGTGDSYILGNVGIGTASPTTLQSGDAAGDTAFQLVRYGRQPPV
jgi:hypothetical protein